MMAKYVVLDDSISNKVRESCSKVCHLMGNGQVIYLPRVRRGGTSHISNWNRAFSDFSLGKAIINLRHHDDYIFANDSKRLEQLFTEESASLVITPVRRVLFRKHGLSIDIIHCPSFIQQILVRHFPLNLLYHFNYIGPSGCIFINGEHWPSVPLFDERLRWLVDCDWYCRIIRQTDAERIRFLHSTENISVENSRSITKALRRQVQEICHYEQRLLNVGLIRFRMAVAVGLMRFAVFLLSLHTLRVRRWI